MDQVEEIVDKGDEYAKRLLIRKREQNQSPECYSKSLRRRLSIIDAIQKKTTQPPRSPHFSNGNPFEREFASRSETNEMTHPPHSTYRVDTSSWDLRPTCPELCSPDGKSLSPIDANCNTIDYEDANKYRRELARGSRNPSGERQSYAYAPRKQEGQRHQNRLSLGGTHLGTPFRRDVCRRSFANARNSSFEEEFARGNAELLSKGPDLFFGARVLEVLEPEVVDRESMEPGTLGHQPPSNVTYVQENFKEEPSEEEESFSTSFVSEDIRDIEREIDKLEFQPVAESEMFARVESVEGISETPKKLYPTLSLVKRMSDNFTPKKLFHANAEKQNVTPGTDYNCNQTVTLDDLDKRETSESKSFSTPMTMPESDANSPNNDSSVKSFLKRNTSFLFNNSHLTKIKHRKPNLESTRKVCNSGGKTISQMLSNVGSTISTLTLPNTPSSPDAYEQTMKQHKEQQIYTQRNTEITLPYEVENFLELALGDENYNSTVTYAPSDMRDRTFSQISDLLSAERTPPMKKSRKSIRIPMTEPSKHMSTLNRTLTIYKTLTQRIKKKFRGSVKNNAKPSEDASETLEIEANAKELQESVKQLLAEVDIQQTLIYQASKALELCNSMREFVASPERVESERLLVLANLRKKAAQDEISRLSASHGLGGCGELSCEKGELTLKDLSMQLREEVLRRERQAGEVVEWFVVVVTEGATVWATQAVECPSSTPRLYLPGQLSIPGLAPDFRLSLRVYSLKLEKTQLFNHEDKYHITRGVGGKRKGTSKRSSCPSPKSFLGRRSRGNLLSPKQREVRFSGIQDSAFLPCGALDLMLHDLNLKAPWPLTGVPAKSVIHGTIDMNLSCKLELSVSHSGFLTHGDEAGGLAAWNRRWCVLEGHNLLFWNYPREQECKPPLYAIDLVNCVSRRIGPIDRSLCAKPRTLLIETARRRSAIDRDSILVECRNTCTLVRNLLSCDTNQDMTEWQSKLNHVISALREWNIIDTKLDL